MSACEHPHTTSGLDNPAVVHAVEEYLSAIRAGQRPDRAAFPARHADLGGPLAECLDALEFVQAAAPSLGGTPESLPGSPTAGLPEPGATLGEYRIVREAGRG